MAADGYRLRLVDVPAAFDRDGFYDATTPTTPWRFAVLCRAALAALERDGTPLDVLHVHDWHTGPALLERARGIAAATGSSPAMAVMLTIHNLAYHGWTGNPQLAQLGLGAGTRWPGPNPDGIDLLLTGGRALRARQHGVARLCGGGADPRVRDGPRPRAAGPRRPLARDPQRHRPRRLEPGHRRRARGAVLARRPRGQGGLPGGPAERVGFDPDDDGAVLGMIGRLDPQKGFDLLADGARELLAGGSRMVVQGSGHASLADPFRALAAASRGGSR